MSNSSSQNEVNDTESNKYRLENSNSINKNVNLAVKQAICWSIMFGIGENTFSLFAKHLNAPLFFYAALAWVPAFLGPVVQMFSADVLDKYQHRLILVYRPVFIQALSFIPLVLIAFFCIPQEITKSPKDMTLPLYIFLFSMFIYNMSGHFSAPPWQSIVGDFVSSNERGSFFAKLNRTVSFFSLAGQLLVGLVLYMVALKFNGSLFGLSMVFASCFLISFFARFLSFSLIKKMVDTPYQAPASSIFTFWQFIKRARESNFVKFVIFSAVLNGGANISGPYFLPYWIDTLGFSQSQWIILSSVGVVATILTLMIWGRFSDIFGNKSTMKYCALLISLTPICWLFSSNLYYLLFLQLFSMIFWTGFNLSSINYIYEAASQPKRARCFAFYSMILGIGIFLGTQIGLFVSKFFPTDIFGIDYRDSFCWVLIISGAVRLFATLVFLKNFKELRDVKPFEINSFWSDVLHIRSVFGVPLIRKGDHPHR